MLTLLIYSSLLPPSLLVFFVLKLINFLTFWNYAPFSSVFWYNSTIEMHLSLHTHFCSISAVGFYVLSHPALRVYSLASVLLMVVPSDVEVFTLSQIYFGKVLTCCLISWKMRRRISATFSFFVLIFGLFN